MGDDSKVDQRGSQKIGKSGGVEKLPEDIHEARTIQQGLTGMGMRMYLSRQSRQSQQSI